MRPSEIPRKRSFFFNSANFLNNPKWDDGDTDLNLKSGQLCVWYEYLLGTLNKSNGYFLINLVVPPVLGKVKCIWCKLRKNYCGFAQLIFLSLHVWNKFSVTRTLITLKLWLNTYGKKIHTHSRVVSVWSIYTCRNNTTILR